MSLLSALGSTAFALALPGCVTLGMLTISALRPLRNRPPNRADPPHRIVILVPAHNEREGLPRTLDSLRQETAGDPDVRVVVIADNCTDDTAEVARSAGVEVLVRQNEAQFGKGYALRFGFAAITDADWLIVIDADTDVEPGFLRAMRQAMSDEVDALQCRYGVRDPLRSQAACLADIALGAWNVLRPRGRAALGLSVGLLGNGFALSRATLRRVPYRAASIVEDVQYHHELVRAGLRVQWVDQAQVRGEIASDPEASGQQQARWEGGRLRLLIDHGPELLQQAIAGHWERLDLLGDLLLLPLAWHCSLLLIAYLLGGPGVQWLAEVNLLLLTLHVFLAMRLIHASPAHWRALLGAPAYVVSKLARTGQSWRAAARDAPWTRSKRHSS